jgi:hypothetical protein
MENQGLEKLTLIGGSCCVVFINDVVVVPGVGVEEQLYGE